MGGVETDLEEAREEIRGVYDYIYMYNFIYIILKELIKHDMQKWHNETFYI